MTGSGTSEREQNFPALLERLRPECEQLVARYERKRSALLPICHLFQLHEGFVSKEAMRAAASMLDLTPAEVEGTVSFYTLFFRRPVGKYVLQVCRGLACSINGAEDLMAYFREKLGVGHLQTTADGTFSYEEVECLAACDRATCMQVNLEFVYDLTPQKIDEMLAAMRAGTYATSPMAQTEAPAATWSVPQDDQVATGRKSSGALGQPSPNNAGGVGDESGIIMLDRILAGDVGFYERTSERAVRDSRAVTEVVEAEKNGGNGASH
ncbi:MAG: NAD(P)H-dependent oxidoreductase subunit E [Candidatus Eremiobacteraeota bacterium]|nr:NAD(P)H-dependent oxidoreductase subunit E [Candidatus Eremiobacteraeota bacterium]MBV8283534.1 NAD(P)H-dependent oxidoreductase subunit E [Candidatus Eremiobacteraeota bacterium]MBV8434824.1 NAD(P)H-dependent oxidoreductase subunit E [Candidatus Eremiobacteraeota bacterium]MBV8654956.1 NAD(P)H-dependent oxidoreductase subunit E [Candidatus Eremiobacteraeota bacterium]